MAARNALRESGLPVFFRAEPTAAWERTAHGMPEDIVRFCGRSLEHMQKEALVGSAAGAAPWRLASDEGAYLAGLDEAPCPLAFFTAGMAASYLEQIRTVARLRAVPLQRVLLVQDNYYTMQGSALRGTMRGGARDVELRVELTGIGIDERTAAALVRDAVAASPANALLRAGEAGLFTLAHNGREVEPRSARRAADAPSADPEAVFARLVPGPGDWTPLVTRGAMTPKTAETTTLAGGSLQESQDRTLHVRGICTMRQDGMKHIEQHLFNPHGSIFHFLSEEETGQGGQGRAPDAAALLAAGLGFCFMTQLGRYAAIVKKPLNSYRIVQDLRFAPGRGVEDPARAAPAVTHLYLESEHDDELARDVLDMAEQTCFLHALCRTPLEPRIELALIGADR